MRVYVFDRPMYPDLPEVIVAEVMQEAGAIVDALRGNWELVSENELLGRPGGPEALRLWELGGDVATFRAEDDRARWEDELELARLNAMSPEEVVAHLLDDGVPLAEVGKRLPVWYRSRGRPFPRELLPLVDPEDV